MTTRKPSSSPTAAPGSGHLEEPYGKGAHGGKIKPIGLPRRHGDLAPREAATEKEKRNQTGSMLCRP